MKITGTELINKLGSNEIPAQTEINVWYIVGAEAGKITTLLYDGVDIIWQPDTFAARYFWDDKIYFEIEEKERELEELKLEHEYYLPSEGLADDHEFKKFVLDELFAQYDKINELVRAVKKIQKENE